MVIFFEFNKEIEDQRHLKQKLGLFQSKSTPYLLFPAYEPENDFKVLAASQLEIINNFNLPLSADIPSTSYCAITDLSKHSLVHLSQETMNLPSKR